MITVITDDTRYDFEADNWTVDTIGQLEVWKTGNLRVALFPNGRWHGVFVARQLDTVSPAGS
jgi:hypothetical protein